MTKGELETAIFILTVKIQHQIDHVNEAKDELIKLNKEWNVLREKLISTVKAEFEAKEKP